MGTVIASCKYDLFIVAKLLALQDVLLGSIHPNAPVLLCTRPWLFSSLFWFAFLVLSALLLLYLRAFVKAYI